MQVARLKDKGAKELESFKKRAKQLEALGRIAPGDSKWLVEHVEEIERYLSRMKEKPELEREFL
ncbi:hypothetical protein SEA_LEOPARD_74 [Mycobacterium phage Leopard]|nr:hypothetical protein SEA_LEOPARD_74 [Mycobacterium phage Leopard]WKW85237.1 hypothetical protein SEA_AIKOY__75 [Mycobacterium phage Aikoy]